MLFVQQTLSIDDRIIDTESNLRYLVLKKNLYKIGLPIDLFSDSQGDIDSLVNRRNSIAHGNFRSGISETEFSSWERKALSVMSKATPQNTQKERRGFFKSCVNLLSGVK